MSAALAIGSPDAIHVAPTQAVATANIEADFMVLLPVGGARLDRTLRRDMG
jgi:hypothetical protein